MSHLLPDLSLREVFNALRYLSSNGQLNLKVDKQEGVTRIFLVYVKRGGREFGTTPSEILGASNSS